MGRFGGKPPAAAHAGTAKEFRDQHDCLYRIAAVDRQIDALERAADNGATLRSHPQDASMIASISEKKEQTRGDHRPIPQIWPQV